MEISINTAHKSITLLGMSGVGKTHFSARLAAWGWEHFSCDYFIGRDGLGLDVSADNLSALSAFIGKVGNAGKGGLALAEFKKRQKIYYDAECASLEKAIELAEAHGKFVNDSSGSLCEIMNEDLIARLGARTTFVYIKATDEENEKVRERAKAYPKPLFFPPAKFDAWLGEYKTEKNISSEGEIEPDDFARWVFPKLFESRLPKYERLAGLYGVTVSSRDLHGVKSEDEFLGLIARR